MILKPPLSVHKPIKWACTTFRMLSKNLCLDVGMTLKQSMGNNLIRPY